MNNNYNRRPTDQRQPSQNRPSQNRPSQGRPSQPVRRQPPSRQRSGGYTSNSTIICILIIAVLVVVNIRVFSGIITENTDTLTIVDRTNDPQNIEMAQKQEAIKRDLKTNFVQITVSADDVQSGNLILVNNDYAYKFDASPKAVSKETLVSFSGRQSQSYTVSYPARETLTPTALESFNALADAFKEEKGHTDLFILDSFRSYEDQEKVYATKGSEIATVPGHSEHHTGLAFDLELYKDGKTSDFDGTGDYSWVSQNCHRFGYILRYPADKVEITEISYEPWHFRYVGKEHAYYMSANNLCLEEYIYTLSKYTADGDRLIFETDDGEKYMIYSQAVSGSSASVYVPKNLSYTLSGDNNGHIIVSCKVV